MSWFECFLGVMVLVLFLLLFSLFNRVVDDSEYFDNRLNILERRNLPEKYIDEDKKDGTE